MLVLLGYRRERRHRWPYLVRTAIFHVLIPQTRSTRFTYYFFIVIISVSLSLQESSAIARAPYFTLSALVPCDDDGHCYTYKTAHYPAACIIIIPIPDCAL